MLTFGVFFTMLVASRSGIIQANEKFKSILIPAIGGIMICYSISLIMSIFGIQNSLIHGNGLFSIGFSIVVVIVAALSLILNFEYIQTGE